MKTRVLMLFLLIFGLSGSAYANQLEVKWMIYFDIAGLLSKLDGQIDQGPEYQKFQKAVTEIKKYTSLDITKDINAVTIFGDNFQENRGMVVVKGNFNIEDIGSAVKDHIAWTATYHNNHTVYECIEETKKEKFLVCYLGQEHMLVTKQRDLMENTLDAVDNQTEALKTMVRRIITLPAGTVFAAMVTEMPAMPAEPATAIMQNIESFNIIAGENAGTVFMQMHGKCKSAESATDLAQMANGIVAMAKLYAKLPQARELLDAFTVTVNQTELDVKFSFPAEEFLKHLELLSDQKAQMDISIGF